LSVYAAAARSGCRTRAAQPTDFDGVRALYRELRPHDPEISPALAREDAWIVVCETDERLVATCMLALIPDLGSGARPIGIVEHVMTLAAHRGRGYGRRVLEHALSLAWSRRCCKVMLLPVAPRTEAHRLYESAGFLRDVERGFVISAPQAAPRATHAPA
jgi:GNAT superfamily N-acetyltransferase